MNISIQPSTEEWIPQVKAFNQRMLAGGLEPRLAFPETPFLEFATKGAPVWQEAFLAVEDGIVRGGYYLTHQCYAVLGECQWIAHYRHPISEAVINKAYKGLGSVLLNDARQRQPLLYSMPAAGEGKGLNRRRIAVQGWADFPVPFWFQVTRPAAFFRNVEALRKTPVRRLLFDLAAFTGTGWLGINALQCLNKVGGQSIAGYASEVVPEFGAWADDIWEQNRQLYLLAAVRDSATLNLRCNLPNSRFRRLKIRRGGQPVGWALLLDKRMAGNSYFGNMHVGSIVDCLAAPGHELAVVLAASAELETAGVDIVISNQSAGRWCNSFRKAGFLSGPSNYIFAVSPKLAEYLHPFPQNGPKLHVNRGDGAGASSL